MAMGLWAMDHCPFRGILTVGPGFSFQYEESVETQFIAGASVEGFDGGRES